MDKKREKYQERNWGEGGGKKSWDLNEGTKAKIEHSLHNRNLLVI